MPCNKNTPACLKSNDVIGDIPECCRANLKNLLKGLAIIFNKSGLRWWLDWGGLLGLIRDGRLIAYDKDLDFGLFYEDLAEINKLSVVIDAYGYKYCDKECKGLHGKIETNHPRVFFSQVNSLFADICLWKQDNEDYYNIISHVSTDLRVNICKKFFYDNLQTIDFEGVTIKIPADPLTYLEMRYGPNWRTPDPKFYENGGYQVRIKQLRKFEIKNL